MALIHWGISSGLWAISMKISSRCYFREPASAALSKLPLIVTSINLSTKANYNYSPRCRGTNGKLRKEGRKRWRSWWRTTGPGISIEKWLKNRKYRSLNRRLRNPETALNDSTSPRPSLGATSSKITIGLMQLKNLFTKHDRIFISRIIQSSSFSQILRNWCICPHRYRLRRLSRRFIR